MNRVMNRMGRKVTVRWRAAVLAALAAVSLTLTGCNDSSPSQTPGTTQNPGGGY